MGKKRLGKKTSLLFSSILIPFLVAMALLIIAVSFISYSVFKAQTTDLVSRQMKSNLSIISQSAERMKQTVNAVALQAYFDTTIKDMLYSDVDPVYFSKYMLKLESYKNINPFLQSIYIYNGHNIYALPSMQFKYAEKDFPDKQVVEILHNTQNYGAGNHAIIPRVVPNILYPDISGNNSTNVYTYLFFDSQVQNGTPSEALILNVSEEWLKDDIKTLSTELNSRILIIDRKGTLVISDPKFPMCADLSGYSFVSQILNSKGRSGYFKANIDGVDSLVSYVYTDVLQWNYICIVPYSQIMSAVLAVRSLTLLITVIMLVLGILLSYALSKRLYIPITSLVKSVNAYELEKKIDIASKKQTYMQELIGDSSIMKPEIVQEQFKSLDIPLTAQCPMILILLRVDKFTEFKNKYNSRDRKLIRYKIIRVIDELMEKQECHIGVDLENDNIALLINVSRLGIRPSSEEWLADLMVSVQNRLICELNLSVSITFSSTSFDLAELTEHYRSTSEYSNYRYIYGLGCMLFSDSLAFKSAIDYTFQKDALKGLSEQIILGHVKDATVFLSDMLEDALAYGSNVFSSTLMKIILTINDSLEALQSANNIAIQFDFNALSNKLKNTETLRELQSEFAALMDSITAQLAAKKDERSEALYDSIIKLVNTEYSDPNLSIDYIEEKLSISQYHMNRVFKKYNNLSIPDYINSIRLEQSKAMLLSTDETINTVMQSTGFVSRSHYYSLFKKQYGLTPREYREQNKKYNKV